MIQSQDSHQLKNNPHSLNPISQQILEFTQNNQDPFAFLKKEKKLPNSFSPFFSKNSLSQDIIQVTSAEPDICLEVFYAFYSTLWPQITSQSDISLKDAWTRFIGGSVSKGILCPPEKLIIDKRVRDLKRLLSQMGGETQVFKDLDQVVSSISHLKDKIATYPGQLLHQEEVMASLSLVQEFYLRFRDRVKSLVQTIIEKEQTKVPYASDSDALEDLLEPKAIMMSDTFTHHWAYRIPRIQAQKLLSLNASGRHLESNLNDPSNHRVIALPENSDEPLVFFKANGNPPIHPEKEFMAYSLFRHLQIPVPETALLILTDVFETNPDYFYALQASEAVLGESSLKACKDQETTFNHEAYSGQTIGALFTNPSDGSFKNFKYSPVYEALISIDNDEVFKPELAGNDRRIVNVKSILYLLPQIDLPIPEPAKTLFMTLDPHLTALAWLQDLTHKNQGYQLLFEKLAFQKTRCIYQNFLPQSEVLSLSTCIRQKVKVDPELHGNSFTPQVFISQNLLDDLIQKFQIIERILSNRHSVTTQ